MQYRPVTLIEATGVTAENMRGKFIAGLIGTQYSKDDKIAMIANGEDTNEHAEELEKFQSVRAAAKKAVDELLSRAKNQQ